MKPSNEFCVKFLEASGWLDNHDKQIRAEVWANIEKIINNMTNPIDTMKIIIKELKEKK